MIRSLYYQQSQYLNQNPVVPNEAPHEHEPPRQPESQRETERAPYFVANGPLYTAYGLRLSGLPSAYPVYSYPVTGHRQTGGPVCTVPRDHTANSLTRNIKDIIIDI